MGGADEWAMTMVPEVLKAANDYRVRVMVVLTYPNYVWPNGPSQVPEAKRQEVLEKAQTTLGVHSKDVFFFWPYLDPREGRHVVKDATTAAILAGALQRAIPLMDERDEPAAQNALTQQEAERIRQEVEAEAAKTIQAVMQRLREKEEEREAEVARLVDERRVKIKEQIEQQAADRERARQELERAVAKYQETEEALARCDRHTSTLRGM